VTDLFTRPTLFADNVHHAPLREKPDAS